METKTNDLSLILNEQQLMALKDTEGAVLVSAGAGSGKTRVLTERIAYLIKDKGVRPYNILAITFTNKAANEMKERVASKVEGGSNVWISTFHSMCARILRYHIDKLSGYDKNFTIYTDSDTDKVLARIFEKNRITDDKTKKEVRFHIANCKNSNMDLISYEKQYTLVKNISEIMMMFREYEAELKKNNALDFDDLLNKTYQLFTEVPEILNEYATRFRYVLVDEFQDTNKIQFDLVKLLVSKNKNIFAVGDENQCIYSWRGANYKNIFEFRNYFENVRLYKLEQNYRSTMPILTGANRLIKNNKYSFDKVLWSTIEEGDQITYQKCFNEKEEANYVASKILSLVSQGYKYSDFAILLRLNALTLPFEEKMLEYNIPHKIYGGFKFYERQEIKQTLAYLRLFVNPKDDISFLRIINFPKRGIGAATIDKLADISKRNNTSMLETILHFDNVKDSFMEKFSEFSSIYKELYKEFETEPLTVFIKRVVDRFGIRTVYSNSDEDIERIFNIDALLKSINDFCVANPSASLVEYLESISLISDIDTMNEGNNVTIATIHAVKGLEYKIVFIVGVEEGIFPISRAFNNSDDLEEERRLMYVGVTRAKQKLFITSTNIRYLYGKNSYMISSRFLDEMELTQNSQYKINTNNIPNDITANYYNNSKKPIENTRFVPSKIDIYNEKQAEKPKRDISEYQIGQIVLHPKFGIGTIDNIDTTTKFADVDFKGFGKKTLLLEVAPLKIVKGK